MGVAAFECCKTILQYKFYDWTSRRQYHQLASSQLWQKSRSFCFSSTLSNMVDRIELASVPVSLHSRSVYTAGQPTQPIESQVIQPAQVVNRCSGQTPLKRFLVYLESSSFKNSLLWQTAAWNALFLTLSTTAYFYDLFHWLEPVTIISEQLLTTWLY